MGKKETAAATVTETTDDDTDTDSALVTYNCGDVFGGFPKSEKRVTSEVMSARDLARIVQEGLKKLPLEEQRQFFTLMSPLEPRVASSLRLDGKARADEPSVQWPDQEARLREILGEKVLSFNPVLEERERSLW